MLVARDLAVSAQCPPRRRLQETVPCQASSSSRAICKLAIPFPAGDGTYTKKAARYKAWGDASGAQDYSVVWSQERALIAIKMARLLMRVALVAGFLLSLTSAIPYDEYILAPSLRILDPILVHRANGSVTNPTGVTSSGNGNTVLKGNSAVTFDYGINIGGLVSFTVTSVNGTGNHIGISFSESAFWISPNGSDATQNVAVDETLWFAVNDSKSYTVDNDHQRGGFRYLTIHHNSTGSVGLSSVTTNYTAMPHYADESMRDYTGYFHSSDEKLNRVWYAAAYTCQLCTIPATSGNSLVDLEASDVNVPTYWWSNSTITNGTSALVDGAKRDKLIWPGDFSISLPGVFLSTNDQYTLKLSVEQLLAQQNATTGQLKYVASPTYESPKSEFIRGVENTYSYTYHLYNLLALYNYFIYSGDMITLKNNWFRFEQGLSYSLESVDDTGLAYVAANATSDWLRIEANSILAYTLQKAISLAYTLDKTSLITTWQTYYDNIVLTANTKLWDSDSGLFIDNTTTTLHPQDGNVWAIISGIANSTQATIISRALKARWGPYGAPAPEAGTTVSPFITSFELQAHFLAGQPQSAIDLMRFMWADFMLDDPRMTNSTFNEGYDVSGALHYPAYADDARISHAHGWSTGPIIALTNFAAGLHIVNSSNWLIQPQPGDLTMIEAGFETAIGKYSASFTREGVHGKYVFETPVNTSGTVLVDIPGCKGRLQDQKWRGHGGRSLEGRRIWRAGWGHHVGEQEPISPLSLSNMPGGRRPCRKLSSVVLHGRPKTLCRPAGPHARRSRDLFAYLDAALDSLLLYALQYHKESLESTSIVPLLISYTPLPVMWLFKEEPPGWN
nr:hypothetical protein CFP56_76277 [Quercus suber]